MKKVFKIFVMGMLLFSGNMFSMNNNNNSDDMIEEGFSRDEAITLLESMGVFIPEGESDEVVVNTLAWLQEGILSLEELQDQFPGKIEMRNKNPKLNSQSFCACDLIELELHDNKTLWSKNVRLQEPIGSLEDFRALFETVIVNNKFLVNALMCEKPSIPRALCNEPLLVIPRMEVFLHHVSQGHFSEVKMIDLIFMLSDIIQARIDSARGKKIDLRLNQESLEVSYLLTTQGIKNFYELYRVLVNGMDASDNRRCLFHAFFWNYLDGLINFFLFQIGSCNTILQEQLKNKIDSIRGFFTADLSVDVASNCIDQVCSVLSDNLPMIKQFISFTDGSFMDVDDNVVNTELDERVSFKEFIQNCNADYLPNESCKSVSVEVKVSMEQLQKHVSEYFDFSNNLELFNVQDFVGFCDSVEAINFALKRFLNNSCVGLQAPLIRLKMVDCIIRYLNSLGRVFSSEGSDKEILCDILTTSSTELFIGLNEISHPGNDENIVSIDLLWEKFFMHTFESMSEVISSVERNKYVAEKYRIINTLPSITGFCISQLIFCSDMEHDMKVFYQEQLLQAVDEFTASFLENISFPKDLRRLLQEFQENFFVMHKNFFGDSIE